MSTTNLKTFSPFRPSGLLLGGLIQCFLLFLLSVGSWLGCFNTFLSILLIGSLVWQLVSVIGMAFDTDAAGSKRIFTVAKVAASVLIAILSATFFLWYWARPSEDIVGHEDEGRYVISGIYLANTHSFPMAADLKPVQPVRQWLLANKASMSQRGAAKDDFYPAYSVGFYLDKNNDEVIERFPPGYTVLLASAYNTGGWWLMQRINWISLLVGAGLFALFAREAGSRWAAAIAGLVLLFNPLTGWVANHFYAETFLIQFWLMALIAWQHRKEYPRLGGLVAGLSLGCSLLLKIDALPLMVLPIIAACFLLRKRDSFLLAAVLSYFTVATAHALLTYHFFPFYYRDTIAAFFHSQGLMVAVPLIVGVLLMFVLARWNALRTKIAAHPEAIRYGLAGLFVLAAAWFYWIRPHVGTPDTFYYLLRDQFIRSYREETFLRLGWYWTPFGVFLFSAGIAYALATTKRSIQWIFLIIGIVSLFALSYDIRCKPPQPYCMRRLIPYAMPITAWGFFMLSTIPFGSVLAFFRIKISELNARRIWLAIYTTVGVILIALFCQHRNRYEKCPTDKGLYAATMNVAKSLPDDVIYLTAANTMTADLAPFLRFVAGKKVFVVTPDENSPQYQAEMTKWLRSLASSKIKVAYLADYNYEDLGLHNIRPRVAYSMPCRAMTMECVPEKLQDSPAEVSWDFSLITPDTGIPSNNFPAVHFNPQTNGK